MNRKILLLLPLFFITTHLPAQLFTGGMKAGIVGAQVDGDGYGGYNKPGIFGGGYVNLRIADISTTRSRITDDGDTLTTRYLWDMSAFQMELAYVQKGARKNPNYELGDFEQYLLRTDYIELALLYQFFFSEKLAFEFGPSIGQLMHTFEERNKQESYSVPFRKVVVNYIGGMYYFVNERLGVNLRANNSILSLRDHDRMPGDTYRFFHYGQFHVSLVLSAQYRL
ncbi:MAG TPA: hypothetical protein ENN08_02415 [Bacteroidales bacterium]|nr:hypothetical protein [Bacteroidales bacterium]